MRDWLKDQSSSRFLARSDEIHPLKRGTTPGGRVLADRTAVRGDRFSATEKSTRRHKRKFARSSVASFMHALKRGCRRQDAPEPTALRRARTRIEHQGTLKAAVCRIGGSQRFIPCTGGVKLKIHLRRCSHPRPERRVIAVLCAICGSGGKHCC